MTSFFTILALCLIGCSQDKHFEQSGEIVKMSAIVGETVQLSGSFIAPWNETRLFTSVNSTCSCTRVEASTLTMSPGKQVDINFTFSSAGMPPISHSFNVMAITTGKEPTLLPIQFSILLGRSIVFDDRVFIFSPVRGNDKATKTIRVMSQFPISESAVSTEELPVNCTLNWREISEKPPSDTRFYYEARMTWNPEQGPEISELDDKCILKIADYDGRDRRFKLQIRGTAIGRMVFQRETAFAGMITTEPKLLDFKFLEDINASITKISGPAWLNVQWEVVGLAAEDKRLEVTISRSDSSEKPPIAGHFVLSIECSMDSVNVIRKIPVLYTLGSTRNSTGE